MPPITSMSSDTSIKESRELMPIGELDIADILMCIKSISKLHRAATSLSDVQEPIQG